MTPQTGIADFARKQLAVFGRVLRFDSEFSEFAVNTILRTKIAWINPRW